MELPRQFSPGQQQRAGTGNFQVPWEVTGRPTVSVAVTRAGESGTAARVPVVELARHHTSDGTQAVVVHRAAYTLVAAGRPLARGEFAFLCDGTRSGRQPVAIRGRRTVTRLARAVADVRVTMAGLPCEVQYAGLAPGFVGVYQVNLRVPENAPGRMAGSRPERRRRSQPGGGGVHPIGKALVRGSFRAAGIDDAQ